jgi:hypothetical protein
MKYRTNPLLEDAVVRSRKLADGQMLDPPADFPVLFSCKYAGQPSIGCVYRNGAVVVMHDRMLHGGVCAFSNVRAAEECDAVTEIKWEWGVVRFLDPPPAALRIADDNA